MYNLNKAMVEGNLTRDPEMKALPSGQSVTTFSIATNRRYKDAEGNYQDDVDYHNIVIWGKQAETANQYLKKGSGAFVEGRMQTRSWEKDGVKHYRTEIVADRVQFGAKPQEGTTSAPTAAAQEAPQYPADEIDPADIPF